MSNAKLVAAGAVVLIAAGAVLLVRTNDEAPPASTPTAVENPQTMTPQTPLARPEAKADQSPHMGAPPAEIESSKADDPKVSPTDHAERDAARATAAEHELRRGETAITPSTANPVLNNDQTPVADVKQKATQIRMRTAIDRVACNVPDAKERLARMTEEDRAAWEKRCARVKLQTETQR